MFRMRYSMEVNDDSEILNTWSEHFPKDGGRQHVLETFGFVFKYYHDREWAVSENVAN